jgi:hypothetical protein
MAEVKVWGARTEPNPASWDKVDIVIYNKPLFWLWFAQYWLGWTFRNAVASVRHYVCGDFD